MTGKCFKQSYGNGEACNTAKANTVLVHVISMLQEAMHIVTHSRACLDDACVLCVCASTEMPAGVQVMVDIFNA